MRKRLKQMVGLAILSVASFVSVYPVLHVWSVSLRKDNSFTNATLSLWPKDISFDTYRKLLFETDFLLWMRNSLLVSGVTTLTGVALAAFAGYGLSRYRFPGRRLAMLSLITTQMFPATMLLLPFFIVLSKLHLINSYIGLVVIYSSTALPFCLWQMKGFYDTIPRELEEAARIDGCSEFSCFWRIILPLSTPALVITALFSFLGSWSEYAVAAVVLQDPELYTLPLGLRSFQASLATQWGLYASGAIVVSVPVVLLFLALSRYLVSGLTLGAVKG